VAVDELSPGSDFITGLKVKFETRRHAAAHSTMRRGVQTGCRSSLDKQTSVDANSIRDVLFDHRSLAISAGSGSKQSRLLNE
jgi:hypothetical protein